MKLRMTMIGSAASTILSKQEISGRLGEWAPGEISLADVHVRTFLAANSRPSKDGLLRIKSSGIKTLAKLYPGAPVMRNHGMFASEDMPIGRVFDAATRTARDDAEELVLPFYLAKGDPTGDMAARYIDLGIWSESSIHGLFESFSCSICGESLDPEDDGACTDHEPGESYEGEMARIELDDPSEAPEFSLCWSGRLAGTRALSREIEGAMSAVSFLARRRSWLRLWRGKTSESARGSWLERFSKAAA